MLKQAQSIPALKLACSRPLQRIGLGHECIRLLKFKVLIVNDILVHAGRHAQDYSFSRTWRGRH